MEHLFLPAGCAVNTFEYPGYTNDYIGVPFLEYPLKHDRSVYLAAWDGDVHLRLAMRADSQTNDTAFLATWLFCGLLQEVLGAVPEKLGEDSLYHHDHYVRMESVRDERGDGKRLYYCTSHLVSSLENWTALINKHKSTCEGHWKHLVQCLNIASTVLGNTEREMRASARSIVATVAELLCDAIDSAFCDADFYSADLECPGGWLRNGWNLVSASAALANGWCLTELESMSSLNNMHLQWAIFQAHIPRESRVVTYDSCPSYRFSSPAPSCHQDCSGAKCNMHSDHLDQQQVQDDCVCDTFQFASSEWQMLLQIIDKGIPLIKCRSGQAPMSYDINVVEYKAGDEYVALSHVWRDGLGNPNANELPLCRVHHVVRAVFDALKARTGERPTDVCFWLDTLCCPVTPKERDKVLVRMQEIYTKAALVLVLDGELQNIDIIDMHFLEIGARIFLSGWMKRLWTLQEGCLAKEIWVRFRTAMFPVDLLKMLDARKVSPEQRRVAEHVTSDLYSICKDTEQLRTSTHVTWRMLLSVVGKRKVTNREDEALCLATYLDLNVQSIIDVLPTDRMKTFWELLDESPSGIPQGIIYDIRPKMSSPGFRWAPQTLLCQPPSEFLVADFQRAKLRRGVGLELRTKGFLLLRTSLLPVEKLQGSQMLTLVLNERHWHKSCTLRDERGNWYSIASFTPAQDVIMSEMLAPDQPGQRALVMQREGRATVLVDVENETPDAIQVRNIQTVMMSEDTSPLCLIYDAAYEIAHQLADATESVNLGNNDLDAQVIVAAKDFASSLPADSRHVLRDFSLDEIGYRIAEYTFSVLAGRWVLDVRTLPDTQKWCFT